MPPNGQTSSERRLASGRRRRRRRSRGRVRAWRSSRERVADASSRRLAVTPPRRRSRRTCTALIFLNPYFVHRYFVFRFLHFSVYAVLVLLYLYSLRVAARIFAFLSHYSCIRRAAAPSVIAFHFRVFAERSLRIYVALRLCQFCVAQP